MEKAISYEEFDSQWDSVKAKVAVFYVNIVILPLAKPFTFVLLNSPLTPNLISVLSSALLIVSVGLLVLHTNIYTSIIFIVLSQISYVLDHCDGAVARIRKKTSRFGALLDVSLDRLNVMVLFMAIGMTSLTTESSDHDLSIYILLFSVSSICYIFYQFVSSMQPHYFPQLRGYMKSNNKMSPIRVVVKIIYEFIDTGIMYLVLGISVIIHLQYIAVIIYGGLGIVLTLGMIYVLYNSER